MFLLPAPVYLEGWHIYSIAFRGLFIYLTPLIPLYFKGDGEENKGKGGSIKR
jgi:hypothetical protein